MSDSQKARQAEANGETAMTVDFRGETFSVPIEYADYPLGFIEAASENAPAAIQIRELFGAEQWARVRAMDLKGRDLDDLANALADARGIDAGNSPASSD